MRFVLRSGWDGMGTVCNWSAVAPAAAMIL